VEESKMGQKLMLELSDPEYTALEHAAEASGETPGEWAASRLREQLPLAVTGDAASAIPPEVYELLVGVAEQSGRSIEEVTTKWIRALAPKPRPTLSAEEADRADERLLSNTVSLGYPTGADNESIDADLARESGDDHASLYREESDGASG
jgi:hypothetical protein